MIRTLRTGTMLAFAALVGIAPAVQATAGREPAGPTTTTITEPAAPSITADLPRTTLEAEQRDDGSTSAARWVIGSGLAAAVSIGVGGTILKRRSARGGPTEDGGRS